MGDGVTRFLHVFLKDIEDMGPSPSGVEMRSCEEEL